MGGIREKPADDAEVGIWLAAAAASAMPVDVRMWLSGGPSSTYPACLAVKTAAEQGSPAAYLRALREGFAFRGRRLDHAEAFEALARERGGLDVERFRIDMGSHAILEAFGADLERSRAVDEAHHSPQRGRVKLPSIEFVAASGGAAGTGSGSAAAGAGRPGSHITPTPADAPGSGGAASGTAGSGGAASGGSGSAGAAGAGPVHGVYGPQPYEAYRDAAIAAGATPSSDPPPPVLEALDRFGPMATAEVASVCRLPGPRAPAELWTLAADWKVSVERTLGGEIWTLA